MITTYLQGGLGNQMFQIAATYSQAKKNKDRAVFNLENSHTPLQGKNSSKYQKTIFKEFENLSGVYNICNKTFQQPTHAYCEIPYETNQQLQGFFQSEKFFVNIKEEIINIFRKGISNGYPNQWDEIKKELSDLRNDLNKPIVSIHIRRGDYLKFKGIHDTCSVDYYNQAMEVMRKKIGDFHAYFISDDINWCTNIFGNHGNFSKYTDEVDDLILMINCDHNIIANSSFSWWGAYLNENDDKVVIGPTKWFGPRGPKDQQDIIPEKWIKI